MRPAADNGALRDAPPASLALAGAYFIWQWPRGGRTLPMKTWRLKRVTREGGALTLRHALARFVFALGGACS